MRVRLLGPLEIVDDAGVPVMLAGPRQRVLLAALAVRANDPVSLDALVEAVWDGAPPPGSAATLRSHLKRLRQALGPLAVRIVSRAPGYLIELDAGEFDVFEFETLCRTAGGALRTAEWERAADLAREALELWRGEPLADVPSRSLRDTCAPQLEQLRVQVLEDSIEAQLHQGRHEHTVGQLRELTARYPLRERFHTQLMLALARAGRRAEALAVYQDARRVLIEDLGIEPGPELRAMQERILAGYEPTTTARSEPAGSARRRVPRQLPAAARHFVGRNDELSMLMDAVRQDSDDGVVVICSVDGMAGIGKTALAVHAAHRLAERFSDGQLFLDLHGHTTGHPPRGPGEALGMLLRALDVPAQRIPEDTEERAALYRQRLADTRTLILLDNALDEAHVRPLLPAAPGCLVLVTSRRRLKAIDDASSLSLDLLPPLDAAMLLRTVAGLDRLPAHDPLLGQVAQLCGRLPLALRIAGALLRHRPAWNLDHLAGLLHDQHQRVRTLADGERDLGAVFDLSYTGLNGRQQLLFRCLGLVPGPDVDAYAAAALLDLNPDTATDLLDGLTDHSLLIAHAPGRYRLHDLIRAHAATLAGRDPAPDREAALDRLLNYYAHTAQTASHLVTRLPRLGPDLSAPAHAPALSEPEGARAWLRAERENLEAAHAHAHTLALDGHVIALATGLAEILHTDGPWSRALEIHQTAVDAAERRQDSAAHATALTELGRVQYLTVDYPGAANALTRAMQIHRGIGDRLGEANALANLGQVRYATGDFPPAADAFARALEIYCDIGNLHGEANALTNLGQVRYATGDLHLAADTLAQALKIHRDIGNLHGEANTLTVQGRVRYATGDFLGAASDQEQALRIHRRIGNAVGEANALTLLGQVRYATEDYAAAADCQARALEIWRAIGSRHGEANALTLLGQVRYATKEYAEAADAQARALEIHRQNGNRGNESYALNHYAATIAASGDRSRALALYQQALIMNRELHKPDDEAISLQGIAEHHLATGDPSQGIAYLHQALKIYQHLGMRPGIERVATRLAGLVDQPAETNKRL